MLWDRFVAQTATRRRIWRPIPEGPTWRQALWLVPPFGTHNAALVGSGAGGLRSKSLQELFGHVGGPVLRIDAEPEGEVGAEDHC